MSDERPDRSGDEARLRELIDSAPYFGEWDEFAPIAYDKIPVLARAVMEHVYGLHDDTGIPYSCCVLCAFFRTDQEALFGEEDS